MKFVLFSIFGFSFCNGLIRPTEWRNDYSLNQQCGGWLKLHYTPMSWNEARLTCHYEGAELASPVPELYNYMKSMIFVVAAGKVYTGIHDSYSKRHFSTIEGVPLSRIPHNWAEGEQNNVQHPESCIALNNQGLLVDLNCDTMLPFICFKKYEEIEMNICGTLDYEYAHDNKTGSCYKFHSSPHTWSRAYMICEAEGGYLAIINSEVEAQVIKDILYKYPASSLPPTAYKGGAAIGFRDMDEHGEWVTVQGQTLSKAGYDKFAKDEPDNLGKQYCGNVLRSGFLTDNSCEDLVPFICEKDPHSLIRNDINTQL